VSVTKQTSGWTTASAVLLAAALSGCLGGGSAKAQEAPDDAFKGSVKQTVSGGTGDGRFGTLRGLVLNENGAPLKSSAGQVLRRG